MAEFDFDFLSLSTAMVGLFFICCAILQKKPKHILEEAFGVASGALRDLKASVFKKNQLILGYFCILIGLILNLFSGSLAAEYGILDQLNPVMLAAALIALVTCLCAVLTYLSRLFSKWHCRRIVTEVVTERRFPFESNVALAIEIGQLLGLERLPDDSVESYLAKLRKFLDLPAVPVPVRRSPRTSKLGLQFR